MLLTMNNEVLLFAGILVGKTHNRCSTRMFLLFVDIKIVDGDGIILLLFRVKNQLDEIDK